jgi:hypothetical protein
VTTKTNSRPRWVEAIYEFLGEREDQAAPLRQVAEHAMEFVPPGPAWREGMAKRKTDARYRGSPDEELSELENLRVVRNGQKRIILKHIYHERKVGRLEKFERNGRPWLRVMGIS